MWELPFEVLSQKRANSYRKSLMFKTCHAGGLTKVSTLWLTPGPAKKNKIKASQEFRNDAQSSGHQINKK